MIKNKIYKFYESILNLRTMKTRNYLYDKKKYQKKNYLDNIKYFERFLEDLDKENIDKYLLPLWKDYVNTFKKSFISSGYSFLRNDVIRSSMFVTKRGKLLKHELSYLEKNLDKRIIKFLLEEESVGDPILLNSKYLTSHNTIHHLYHLVFFIKKLNVDLDEFKSVVEWGGGYGNLARLFMKMNPSFKTYTIIDVPLFSCLQWIYLSSVFGPEKVNLIKDDKCKIEKGKINLLPLCFLDNFSLDSELFISTWALNESSIYSQEYVKNKKFFNSKYFLMVVGGISPKVPNSHHLINFYKDNNFLFYKTKFLEGSNYIFKK